MIRITVELLPHGNESRKRHLGTAVIYNTGAGTPARGHYRVRLSRRGNPDSVWKSGEVINFPRKRLGAWDLLFLALSAALGDRTIAHKVVVRSVDGSTRK